MFKLSSKIIVIGLILISASACGIQKQANNPTQTCTMILSGAVTGTYPCTAGLSYDAGKNLFGLGVSTSSGAANLLPTAFAMTVSGDGRPGTYDASTAHLAATTGVANVNWAFDSRAGQGSGAVQITSLDAVTTNSTGTIYCGSGTANATMTATATTASGQADVTMQINFGCVSATPTPGNVNGQVIQATKNFGQTTPEVPIAIPTLPLLQPSPVSIQTLTASQTGSTGITAQASTVAPTGVVTTAEITITTIPTVAAATSTAIASGSGNQNSCSFSGTWGDTHAAGPTQFVFQFQADAATLTVDRSGGGFPSAHIDGTFTYDATTGHIVMTNTAAQTSDTAFNACIGVPGTYSINFPDCTQAVLTLVSDACGSRVRWANGAILTKH